MLTLQPLVQRMAQRVAAQHLAVLRADDDCAAYGSGSPQCLRSMQVRSASGSFADLVDRVAPSIVQIEALMPDPSLPTEAPRRVVGSGVITSADGYVLTNSHVVTGSTSVSARLSNGTSIAATMIGHDAAIDIALIKLASTGLPAAPFGNSDEVRVGDIVLAIGSPFGLGQTVTSGIVGAKGRELSPGGEKFIQTDAGINPGNSGGALVDMSGKVIGINTLIIGRGQGIGFALPANAAVAAGARILANPDPPYVPPAPIPLPEVKADHVKPIVLVGAGVLFLLGIRRLARRG